MAVGKLQKGYPSGFSGYGTATISTQCIFRFEVSGIPAADFYGIEITHRGTVNYSRQQVTGEVQLKLGS